MKKSLIVFAGAAALAGAVHAQSTVEIYGTVDLSLAKSNGGTAPNQGAPANNSWALQESQANRLGFRGNEDLGGGLSAQFQMETRFKLDTGSLTNANAFWHARSYVQLTKANVGSVYFGREFTPVFWPAVLSDPFGWDGVGKMDLASYGVNGVGGYLTPATNGNGIRTNNTVGFRSANWDGFTVQAAVGLDEDSGIGRTDGFNVQYNGGPVYAAVGYERVKGGSGDGTGLTNLALHYNFGVAKVMGYVAQAKWGAGGTSKSKIASIGSVIPLASGNIKAIYFIVNPDGPNNDSSKLGLGYDHFLSKRTNLYADVGFGRMEGRSNNTAFAFGIKHKF